MPRLPACTPKDVIHGLGRAGFVFDHSTGAHHYYRHTRRHYTRPRTLIEHSTARPFLAA